MANTWTMSLVTAVVLLNLSVALAGWGPWSNFSPCSRTCGGGVTYRERLCRGSRSVCVGKSRKHKLCNTKDCKGGEDFRAEQCSRYDGIPQDGVLYTWSPYYGEGETCELLCFADGDRFFQKLADKVIDGTMCHQDKQRVCIDGRCKTVGCDKKIGSKKMLDVCGVCGGDNSTCSGRETVMGVYNTTKLSAGYSSVVEIPQFAENIYIRELGTNLNPIVIWDSSGDSFALEPDSRSAKMTWKMADTTFRYLASDPDNTYGYIKCTGPTSRNLTVFVVRAKGDNPGIEYRFSIPKVPQNRPWYKTANGWSNVIETAATSGTDRLESNRKYRPVPPQVKKIQVGHNPGQPSTRMLQPPSGMRISTSHINNNRHHNRRVNPYNRLVKYGDTSVTDNAKDSVPKLKQRVYENTIQVIDKTNKLRTLGEAPSAVPVRAAATDSYTWGRSYESNVEPVRRPGPRTETEVVSSNRFQWSHGSWTVCSKNCGTGIQRRSVSCIDRELRKTTDTYRCNSQTRPKETQSCSIGNCQLDAPSVYVRWQVGNWGPCSNTCDLGIQVQEVFCESVLEDGRSLPVDDELCLKEYRQKPSYRRSCNDGVPCVAWKITPWGRCSVTCGEGYQVRRVDCRGNINVYAEESCDPNLKPPTSQKCTKRPCRNPGRRTTRPSCLDTYYGCCPDDVTPARGRNYRGCKNIKIGVDDATVKPKEKAQPIQPVSGVCSMDKPLTSLCTEWKVKWAYNKEKQICERFWFGGCEGVANKFDSEKECEATCKPTIEEDVCIQPVVTGRCRARHRRFYYNKDRRECLEFVYGGCDGNGNRFHTKDDCERTCLAGTSALGDDGGCKNSRFGCCLDGKTAARTQSKKDCPNPCQTMYYGCCDDDVTPATGPNQEGCETIEISSGTDEPCDQSEFGCCVDGITAATGLNKQGCDDDHTVPAVTQPINPDITVETPAYCREPKEMGPCRKDPVVMWYYDTTKQKCARFWYGGCQGNNNRFKSEKECLTTCGNYVAKATTPVCEQPKEIGPCKALIPRWFFNQDTNTCEEFSYGGCRGNDNNFASVAECERQCRRGTPVSKPGRCPAVVESDNGTCNANCRYDGDCPGVEKCCALSDFCRTCSALETQLDTCDMPQVVGPCRAGLPRYYYNRATYQCEIFRYGGCGGNRNNFETIEACQTRCRVRTRSTEKPVTKTYKRQPVCSYAPDRGPCERSVTKYHYNLATMTCESFTYGGCLGNHNNFETEAKCQQYCGLRKSSSWKANCGLMKEEGPCKANLQRWYYDSRTGRCYQFTYGGCQGNGNNFADERTCSSTCRGLVAPQPGPSPRPTARPTVAPPAVEEDVCSLSLRTTNQCNSGVSSYWYYDQLTGVCKEIPNGECNSNRNNFQSRAQCEGYCSQDRVCQPLTYTTDIRCLALMPRWTYNRRSGNCESFNYGGCGGSSNNFQTKEACDRKCDPGSLNPVTRAPEPVSRSEVCAMPESAGNCLAYIRNWRYDSLTGQCVQFTYGGCGGNENNFGTREECESFCSRSVVCQAFEEPEVSCLAYYSRWRFDAASSQCENFVYGGCGGNANNFETIESCESKCITRPEVVNNTVVDYGQSNTWRDICNLQADVGPCKQYIRKWHFNSVSQTCEEFTYGGCLGNHNNFESKLQCMTYCDPQRSGGTGGGSVRPVTEAPEIEGSGEVLPPVEPETGVDVCHLDSETGQCRAFTRLWFYNHLSGQCEQFVYGGCHGNNNRFGTQQECEATCSPREVCLLPQQSGNCMSYIRRWFFDYNEQKCKEFAYGGCDGNANNFETEESCETRCEPLMRQRPPDVNKEGTCPSLQNNTNGNGKCMEQCRKDGDCEGSKKCCTVACSLVCVEPTEVVAPPTVVTTKYGYCPPRTDWQGLLGACAPQCQDDSTCPGDYKCCHHGCGYRCIAPVDEEPYQMDVPVRVSANTVSNDAIHLTWYDQSLGREQKISDGRYYTIRYHSYALGQYNYMNVTDLRGHVNGLQENTEYEFSVRVNNPPYLSNWSSVTRNTTRQRAVVKGGVCPAVGDDQFGICVEECQNDGDCGGSKKCCSNGCGRTCMNPQGFDICKLPTEKGSCSNWEVRWYYNNEDQICDRFWYGGCNEGNENNFMDQDECESRCIGLPAPVGPETQAPPYDCRRTTFGCCADGYTGALDAAKSNCREVTTEAPYDCRRTRFGCCADGYNTALDADRSNCAENRQNRETIVPAIPGESVVIDCRYGANVTWYRDGKLVESNAGLRVNSDGTIQVFSATIEDDGAYACHVPGEYGPSKIYRYVLQVRVPIGILPGPAQILVKPNHQAFLHCEVYGNPKPSVTWQRYGSVIQTSTDSQTFSNGTLLIYKATEADQGQYTCTADNRVSQSASRTIELMLREMLVARIENDNGRVMEGSRITITCEGRGFPQPSVTWEKSGKPLQTNGNVFISDTGRLVIRDSTLDDSGVYTCIVANNVEKIETSTSVQVVPKSMPDDKCEDRTSLMKCRLIVTARLCGYAMYSKICCNSCLNFFTARA